MNDRRHNQALWQFPLLLLLLTCGLLAACHTPNLAPGGAYSGATLTTNADGSVTTNAVSAPDPAFFLADQTYKTAYETVDAAFNLEYNNRATLQASFPQVKKALDAIRPTVWNIDQRWAAARKAYMATPTPTGLTTLQGILAEIQKLVPVAEAAAAIPAIPPTTTNSVSTP